MSYSSRFPASKATGSNRSAAVIAASDRSAVCSGSDPALRWARDSVSISSTSSFIRRLSSRMLSIYTACSGSADWFSSSAEDNITVSGVFSSWLASDKTCSCCAHAAPTGRVTTPDSR